MYVFTPPTRREFRAQKEQFWNRTWIEVGRSVIKKDGFYTTVDEPTAEQVDGADKAYLGGRDYIVTDDEAALLTSAGFGANLRVLGGATFGYGMGRFGRGTYGDGEGIPSQDGFGDGAYGDGTYSG